MRWLRETKVYNYDWSNFSLRSLHLQVGQPLESKTFPYGQKIKHTGGQCFPGGGSTTRVTEGIRID